MPNVKKLWGLNLPRTPWATSACCGRPFYYYYYYYYYYFLFFFFFFFFFCYFFHGAVHNSAGQKTAYFSWNFKVPHYVYKYTTNQQVAGLIPNGVSGIFQWHNPSGHTMALGSTKPLTEVPGVLPGGKGGRCVGLTTLPPSCAVVMKSGNLNFLEPSGLLQACNGTALPLPFKGYVRQSL